MTPMLKLLVVASLVLLFVSAEGACDAPGLGKLESSSICEEFCGADTPCVVLDASSGLCDGSRVNSSACTEIDDPVDGDGSCAYVCAFHSTTTMQLFVNFGSYKSEEEASASNSEEGTRSSSIADLLDDSDGYFAISDNVLNAIGSLSVGAYASSVDIIGGTILYYSTRGTVVNVSLEDEFLSSQVNLTEVSLSNINLKGKLPTLPSLLPPMLTSLTLSNDLQYDFPWVLAGHMTRLEDLTLWYNYISNVSGPADGDPGFDSLKSLTLSQNSVAAFDATFPSLNTLYLDNNFLVTFPELENSPQLTYLSLNYNNITVVSASTSSDSLQTLALQSNLLTTFEGYFPNLQYIYLDGNKLSSIPDTIYQCKNLSVLSITSNPLNLTFTQNQLEFLRKIDTLDITAEDTANSYSDCVMADLKGLAVCIVESSNGSSAETASVHHSVTGTIVGGSVGGFSLILIVAGTIMLYRRRYKTSDNYQSFATPSLGSTATGSSEEISNVVTASTLPGVLKTNPRLLSLLLNPRDVVNMRTLRVSDDTVSDLIKYQTSSLIMSKRLRKRFATPERTAKLVQEAKLVSTLDHPNILKLVGVSWRQRWNGELDIVSFQVFFEYAEKGSLQDYLNSSYNAPGWDTQKLEIAINVADALVYIHSLVPPIIHKNVCALSILLTDDFQGKLAGFGDAKQGSIDSTDAFEKQREIVKGVTTTHWMAPESLSTFHDSGESADVFSFGLLLLELESNNEDAQLLQIASGEIQPSFHPTCPTALSDLVQACLSWDPSERPSAPEIAYKLRRFLKEF